MVLNPIMGCSKCSPGCANCYAESFAARLMLNPYTADKYANVLDREKHWSGKISADFSCLSSLPRKIPKRVFVGSMSDIFHQKNRSLNIDILFATAALFPHHTFIMLTRRAAGMHSYFTGKHTLYERKLDTPDIIHEMLRTDIRQIWLRKVPHIIRRLHRQNQEPYQWPLPNVWLGVTVCNQAEADLKIPLLLECPASRHFVSIEPMLGSVNVAPWLSALSQKGTLPAREKGLDWVICGGETGQSARPMHVDWARSVRDQCLKASVPFFFKGFGAWGSNGTSASHALSSSGHLRRIRSMSECREDWACSRFHRKRHSGQCVLDDQEWCQYPV